MKVLQFSGSWCAPCKALKEVIAKANFTTEFEYVDVDTQLELVAQYGIRGVPTLILLDDDGKEVRRKSGFMPESQLKEFVGE